MFVFLIYLLLITTYSHNPLIFEYSKSSFFCIALDPKKHIFQQNQKIKHTKVWFFTLKCEVLLYNSLYHNYKCELVVFFLLYFSGHFIPPKNCTTVKILNVLYIPPYIKKSLLFYCEFKIWARIKNSFWSKSLTIRTKLV